ncbi:MAG TPA: hypothetical protein VGX91_11955 [Candidatus Cybelea sp.]|jgi:hypothetical protein|nr:hypothetical protein [Candidatus Cybelea sp.]
MHRIIIAAAAATAMLLLAGPAVAHGYNYSGVWPVTITGSQFSNGTGCLTLNGGASGGGASLVFGAQKYNYGSFLVIRGTLVATIQEPLYGQNGALLFIGSADRARIGPGLFENVEGGSNFDAGKLAFGMKNGC